MRAKNAVPDTAMTAQTNKRPAAIRVVIPFVFRHWLEQPARAWCRLAGDPIQKHRDAQRASDYRPSLGEQDDAAWSRPNGRPIAAKPAKIALLNDSKTRFKEAACSSWASSGS